MSQSNLAKVQVMAFREPNIRRTLDAIADQAPPNGWIMEYEAWVTLDREDNETWLAANAHDVFTAHEAPPGKLSARNAAHNDAFAGDAHSVVVWDADAIPAHDGVLAAVLDPLDGEAIAVNSRPRPPRTNPVNILAEAAQKVEQATRPHINGQLNGFHRGAWVCAGPFRDSVDQLDVAAVRREEEFRFYDSLRACGSISTPEEAVVIEDARRIGHHLTRPFGRFGRYPTTEWERDRGVKTFMPRDRR